VTILEIICNNLQKKYNDKTVLHLPHLHIESGKILGIIGENGAGKSTLLSILSGLETQTVGNVMYDKQALTRNIMKQITLVFQKPVILRGTVLKNILYPLQIRGITKKEATEQAKDMLQSLKLYSLRKQKALSLSGGEQQKLALGRALVFKPKLLLLDEPTANIDPYIMEEIEEKILAINKLGTTVVIVTHHLEQSKRLCHNVLQLKIPSKA
jgi:tungstate transport system ATP-binding protein